MDKISVNDPLSVKEACGLFEKIMQTLNKSDHATFLTFIEDNWRPSEYSHSENVSSRDGNKTAMATLKKIAEDIRSLVPFDAILATESILTPTKGENMDCDSTTTIHVDGFLYDDEEMDELMERKELQCNYCADCGSKNIKPCVIISHSMSVDSLHYIFNFVLPDLHGKTVLDVGSRLGAVLYGAYIFTSARRIIGVEMNADFCKLQADIVHKYEMEDRIEIVNKRIEDCPEIVEHSDIIILNNVFEFYVPEAVHIEIWKFLRATTRKGTILITRPHIGDTFEHLNTGIVISDWVKPYESSEKLEGESQFSNGDPLNYPDIMCYEVI